MFTPPQKETPPHPVHLAFCFDAKYAPYAAVAIASALYPLRWSASPRRPVQVHAVVASDDSSAIAAVRDLQARHGDRVRLSTVNMPAQMDWKDRRYFSRAVYLRLFASEVIEADRVLYIDGDTLVLSPLDDLFDVDLGSALIAGALDPVCSPLIPADEPYLNSGVMLMDLAAMRREGFAQACVQAYDRYHDQLIYPDQCLINKVAQGRKKRIDSHWNHRLHSNGITPDEWALAQQQASILHFYGGMKPWMPLCNPLIADLWWSVADTLGIDGLSCENPVLDAGPLLERLEVEFPKLPSVHARWVCDMLSYADVLEGNGDSGQSNRVRDAVIFSLFKRGIPALR